MIKRTKSEIQFAYNSYATALIDAQVLMAVANNLLIHRKRQLEVSFGVSLRLLKIHYDEQLQQYRVDYAKVPASTAPVQSLQFPRHPA